MLGEALGRRGRGKEILKLGAIGRYAVEATYKGANCPRYRGSGKDQDKRSARVTD